MCMPSLNNTSKNYIFLCMCVYLCEFICTNVCRNPAEGRRDIKTPEPGATGDCALPCGWEEQDLGPLWEQPTLLYALNHLNRPFRGSFFHIYICNVYEFICICVCMCTNCAPGALRGQRGTLDPLELELQTIMDCYVGTGNPNWILCKSNKCYATSQAPRRTF